MVAAAIALAVRVHAGQLDKAGQPYILHPLRVMFRVAATPPVDGWTQDEEMTAAVLHDVVEDCGITIHHISHEFGLKISEAVDRLTRCHHRGESYMDYIRRLKPHAAARKIKLADLTDNLNRVRELPEGERSIAERYYKAKRKLQEKTA